MADQRSEEAIEKLRAEMDALDDEILTLVRRRFNLSRRIMTDQHRYGMPVEVFSHDREQQTIDRLKKLNEDSDCPMRGAHIGNIWQMIFSCTRVGW
ncbi:chorismate mutase [Mailhella massiliensis]|uniref:chorismate mutase n=1 Tax=Mailhella massiliensis TaxID=1903261 RepID=UPI00097E07BF|nr:chorismate mutase [Mailhella massiliensis]